MFWITQLFAQEFQKKTAVVSAMFRYAAVASASYTEHAVALKMVEWLRVRRRLRRDPNLGTRLAHSRQEVGTVYDTDQFVHQPGSHVAELAGGEPDQPF